MLFKGNFTFIFLCCDSVYRAMSVVVGSENNAAGIIGTQSNMDQLQKSGPDKQKPKLMSLLLPLLKLLICRVP